MSLRKDSPLSVHPAQLAFQGIAEDLPLPEMEVPPHRELTYGNPVLKRQEIHETGDRFSRMQVRQRETLPLSRKPGMPPRLPVGKMPRRNSDEVILGKCRREKGCRPDDCKESSRGTASLAPSLGRNRGKSAEFKIRRQKDGGRPTRRGLRESGVPRL